MPKIGLVEVVLPLSGLDRVYDVILLMDLANVTLGTLNAEAII